MSRTDRVIEVRNWTKFQHYNETRFPVPPWIKCYTSLLLDPAYLELTPHRRALLHGLWLMYATQRRLLADNTTMIARTLALRVTSQDLDALQEAGFIARVSRQALDPTRAREEEEGDPSGVSPPKPPTPTAPGRGAASAADHNRPMHDLGLRSGWTQPYPPWHQTTDHRGTVYAIQTHGPNQPPLIVEQQPPWPPEGA